MPGSMSSGFEVSSGWRNENCDTWILPQSCATLRHLRAIDWKRSKVTERDSTAFASTINRDFVFDGMKAMPTKSKSSTITDQLRKTSNSQRDWQPHQHSVTYRTSDNRRRVPHWPAVDCRKRQDYESHHEPDKFAVEQP